MEINFPDDWQLLPLEKCMAEIIDYRGKTPNKTSFGIPLITAKIVKGGRINQVEEYIATEDYDVWMRRGFPKPGDIVITTEAPLGEIAQLDNRKVALAQRLITLRGKSDLLNNDYLKFLMQSSFAQNQLYSRASGTTVQGIKQSELRKITLVIPPLPEQKAIARILSSLDDKIELNREMNKTLEAMAKAIFKSWFVDFDPVRAKMEGRQPAGMDAATAELFPDAFEESALGLIPKGWQVDSYDKIVHILSGGTPKTSVSEYWNGNILWFSVKDAPDKSDVFVIDTEKRITQLGVDKSATQVLPKGTTIITARGTVGKLALVGVEMAMNQSCFGIKGKNSYTDLFIYYHLSSVITELQHKTHGSVFDTINRQTFISVKAVIPLKQIAQAFDNVVKPLIDKLLVNLFESRNISSIRDTLLPKLLSGEIRVKEAEKIVEEVM